MNETRRCKLHKATSLLLHDEEFVEVDVSGGGEIGRIEHHPQPTVEVKMQPYGDSGVVTVVAVWRGAIAPRVRVRPASLRAKLPQPLTEPLERDHAVAVDVEETEG